MSFGRLISLSALFPALVFLGGCSGNWGWYVVNPSTPAGQRNLMFLLDGLYFLVLMAPPPPQPIPQCPSKSADPERGLGEF